MVGRRAADQDAVRLALELKHQGELYGLGELNRFGSLPAGGEQPQMGARSHPAHSLESFGVQA